ncbi:hypothetical protein NQZ68_000458 [Dissostichus eleginoides]|nr:hypothetical protein NQZ68_000458 [Dissostichus eleginoides]
MKKAGWSSIGDNNMTTRMALPRRLRSQGEAENRELCGPALQKYVHVSDKDLPSSTGKRRSRRVSFSKDGNPQRAGDSRRQGDGAQRGRNARMPKRGKNCQASHRHNPSGEERQGVGGISPLGRPCLVSPQRSLALSRKGRPATAQHRHPANPPRPPTSFTLVTPSLK